MAKLHNHNWIEREIKDRNGRTIKGFQCKSCLKRDYVDLVGGRPVIIEPPKLK